MRQVYQQASCLGLFTSQSYFPYSARVDAGDTVTFSYWASVTSTSGGPESYIEFQYFNSSGSGVGVQSDPGFLELGTSYAQHSRQVVAPAGAYFMYALVVGDFLAVGTSRDIDDCVLGIEE